MELSTNQKQVSLSYTYRRLDLEEKQTKKLSIIVISLLLGSLAMVGFQSAQARREHYIYGV